jgi:pimeloyl-ACP methyl ester carboxylesterase
MQWSIEPVKVPTVLGDVAVHVLGEGRPTVLWHELFVDASSWGYVVPALLPGRRLLLVDGPGWGRSDRLPRTARDADAVTAAVEVLDALSPSTPVDWVGNGWGGRVGTALAATRPDRIRSLVAIAAPTDALDAAAAKRFRRILPLLRLFGPLTPSVRDPIFDALLTRESRMEPGSVGAVLDALALAGGLSRARAVRAFLIDRVDLTDLLPRIEAPTLLVAGDDDPGWSPEQAERAAALAPFARAVTVRHARALVALEDPQRLGALVREFWASLEHPS